MNRPYPFPACARASVELDFSAPVRLNSSRIRFSPWKSCWLATVLLATVFVGGLLTILTGTVVLDPDAQIWVAQASDHGAIDRVILAGDGKTLASVDSNGYATLWDLSTGRRSRFQPDCFDRIRSLACSPDGRTFAGGDLDSAITIYDADSLEPRSKLRGHSASVIAMAYSLDGQMLASACADGTLNLWRTTPEYSIVHRIQSPTSMGSICFSPDGTILATEHSNGEVRVRNVASPQESSVVSCRPDVPRGIAFSPDGRTLAISAMFSPEILLWDVGERRLKESFNGPASGAPGLAYSPDGKVLAITGNDGTLELWDMPSGRRRAAVQGLRARVRSVTFSRDGRIMASCGNDHCVRLWDVRKLLAPADETYDQACGGVRIGPCPIERERPTRPAEVLGGPCSSSDFLATAYFTYRG
jgi:WD40 repeat protein